MKEFFFPVPSSQQSLQQPELCVYHPPEFLTLILDFKFMENLWRYYKEFPHSLLLFYSTSCNLSYLAILLNIFYLSFACPLFICCFYDSPPLIFYRGCWTVCQSCHLCPSANHVCSRLFFWAFSAWWFWKTWWWWWYLFSFKPYPLELFLCALILLAISELRIFSLSQLGKLLSTINNFPIINARKLGSLKQQK